jgi:hypothetical protein
MAGCGGDDDPLTIYAVERRGDGTLHVYAECAHAVQLDQAVDGRMVTLTLHGRRVDGDCASTAPIPGPLPDNPQFIDGSSGDRLAIRDL